MGNAKSADGAEAVDGAEVAEPAAKVGRKKSAAKNNKVAVGDKPAPAPIPEVFTPGEAKKLKDFFNRLESKKKSSLSATEKFITVYDIEQIPELSMNPFVGRLAQVVYEEAAESNPALAELQIDFDTFLRILQILHPDSSVVEKQVYSFKAFDIDGDGELSFDDLVSAMALLHQYLPRQELDLQAALVFEGAAVPVEDKLTPDHFFKLWDPRGFARFFTVHF